MSDLAPAAARRMLVVLAFIALAGIGTAAQPPSLEPPYAASVDREGRRDVLNRVLARPEFQRTAASVLMERVRERVARWLLDVWQRFIGPRLGERGAATVFAWIVGLLALAALTSWLVQVLSRSSPRHALGLAPPAGRRRTAAAWARDAVEAYRAGDARDAARCAYRAALTRLEDEGAWRQHEARTPREYLRLLPASHHRRQAMADLTARFERAWYGTETGTPDDSRAVLARLEELGCLASGRAS